MIDPADIAGRELRPVARLTGYDQITDEVDLVAFMFRNKTGFKSDIARSIEKTTADAGAILARPSNVQPQPDRLSRRKIPVFGKLTWNWSQMQRINPPAIAP